jgi:hypothetical protein
VQQGEPLGPRIASSRLPKYDVAPHGLFASHKERLTDDVSSFMKTAPLRADMIARPSAAAAALGAV